MSHRPTVAAITLVSALLQAPAAMGQVEEGVTVDPASPAGKEYALPIDRARREAADPGGRPSRSSASTPATAFGAGVGPDAGQADGRTAAGGAAGSDPAGTSSSTGPSAQADASGAAADGRSAEQASSERARERERVDRALTKARVGEGEGGDTTTLLLGGLGVTVLGIAAGLLLRRRTT